MLCIISHATAETMLEELTQTHSAYTGPSLEDNVITMDKDKNGFADVFEVRAFLELKHGQGYEKELLDRWILRASGNSCTVPTTNSLYSDAKN